LNALLQADSCCSNAPTITARAQHAHVGWWHILALQGSDQAKRQGIMGRLTQRLQGMYNVSLVIAAGMMSKCNQQRQLVAAAKPSFRQLAVTVLCTVGNLIQS